MAPHPYNKTLSCRREKRACYSVLSLLFLLSAGMLGISFLPGLQGTRTRVYLWILSCSLFIISSTVVLFLLSFCNRCHGCHIENSEAVLAKIDDIIDEKEKSISPASTITPREVPDLRKYRVGPIPQRRSVDTDESHLHGQVLSNIDEESIRGKSEISAVSSVTIPPSVSMEPERKGFIPHAEKLNPADDLYVAPHIATGTISSIISRDQRAWEFEKDWTT
ncbi:hypothetical protein BDD12DRAFT_19745 [Trichophaea hybrida]|nr:hypothetical protein BDD12DRAFT_19745 [Trichophaea hybrida]